jgi:hypothetical protein
MPPLEAMACGTPAIVCRNSSLPEVVADAAIFVDENDATDMQRAIVSLLNADTRRDLVDRGFKQAGRFRFDSTASQLAEALLKTYARLQSRELPMPGKGWAEFRRFQSSTQCSEADSADQPSSTTDADLSGSRSTRMSGNGELALALQTISSMRRSPFWKARDLAVRILRKLKWRERV